MTSPIETNNVVELEEERDRRAITRMLVKWRAFKRRCNPIASLTQGGKNVG